MPTFKRRDQEQMEKAKDLLETAPAELGFVKSLFFGRLKLGELFPYPRQSAEEAARHLLKESSQGKFHREHVDAFLSVVGMGAVAAL